MSNTGLQAVLTLKNLRELRFACVSTSVGIEGSKLGEVSTLSVTEKWLEQLKSLTGLERLKLQGGRRINDAAVAARQSHGGEFWTAFFIRTVGPARDQIAAVRREASLVEPSAAAFPVIPFEEHVSSSLFPQRVAAALLSVLGAIALLLAALGLYGVLAFAVGQREHEFGIRMALGAQSRDVLETVVRQGLLLALAGVVAGVILAFVAARLIGGLLVNLSASDPLILGGASLFLVVVAFAASYLPARQATKVDPLKSLRQQ